MLMMMLMKMMVMRAMVMMLTMMMVVMRRGMSNPMSHWLLDTVSKVHLAIFLFLSRPH